MMQIPIHPYMAKALHNSLMNLINAGFTPSAAHEIILAILSNPYMQDNTDE